MSLTAAARGFVVFLLSVQGTVHLYFYIVTRIAHFRKSEEVFFFFFLY